MSTEEAPVGDPFPGIPLKQVSVKRKGEKDQPKSNEVFFINENYKDTSPQFAELLKLITKYQQTVEVLSGIGMEMADLIKHIGQTNDSNLGEGLNSLGETLALIEVNRKSKLTEVGFETWSAEIGLDQRGKEMALFERDFKKKHGDGYRDIRKLQQQKQKFHKGTTKGKAKGKAKAEAKYEETTKALTEKIAEMDAFESQKLQEVVLLDRKRYAVVVSLLSKTMSALAEHSETTLASIRPHEKRWAEVGRSENSIPDRLQQLITSKPVLSNSPPPSPRTSQSFETLPPAPKDEPKKDDSSKKEKEERKKKEKEEEERRKKEKKDKKGKKDEPSAAQKVQGLYQWVPRASDELAIEVGMEVTLIEEVNEEWWLCSDGTKQGLVPSNYVKKL